MSDLKPFNLMHMFDSDRETLVNVWKWDWGGVYVSGEGLGLVGFTAEHLILTNARILALGRVYVHSSYRFATVELEDIEAIDDTECAKGPPVFRNIKLEFRDRTHIQFAGVPKNLSELAQMFKSAWQNHIPLVRFPREEQMLYKARCVEFPLRWITHFFDGCSLINLALTDHRLLLYGVRIIEKEETSQRGRVIQKVVHFSGPCLKLMSIPLSDVVKVRTNFRLAKTVSKMELVLKNKPCELTLSSFTIPPYTDSVFAQEQYVLTNSASMKQAGKELTLELVLTSSATRTILSLLYQAIPSTVEISDSPHVTIPQILQIKQCPDCGKMVASEATTCRYCNHPFDPSEVAAAQAAIQTLELQAREKSRKEEGLALTVLGGLLLFIGLALVILLFGPLLSLSDDLTGFVVIEVILPLLVVVGSLLLWQGIRLLLGARKAASSGKGN